MCSYTLALMPHITPKVEESLALIRAKSANRGTAKTFDRNLAIYRSCIHDEQTVRSVARRFELSVQTVEKILTRVRKAIQQIERKIAAEAAVA